MHLRSGRKPANDKTLALQVGPVDLWSAGQFMSLRKRDVDPLLPKWRDFTIRNATISGHERHIQLSPPDRADMLVTAAIPDVDSDLRVPVAIVANEFP